MAGLLPPVSYATVSHNILLQGSRDVGDTMTFEAWLKL